MVIRQWLSIKSMEKMVREKAIIWFKTLVRSKKVIKVDKVSEKMTSEQLKKNK